MHLFASSNLHISLAAEPVFYVGWFAVTNAIILGAVGFVLVLAIGLYVARKVKRGEYNRFVGAFQWMFELLLRQVHDIIPDAKLARKIAPLAIGIFITVLFTYWLSVLPGVGPITWNGVPILRGLPADLNFTFALAIITVITVQFYAIKHLGVFGNAKRYLRNPFKDPIGSFEGILEIIGEFSRGIALSLRLFGNAFAGEVLLIVIALLTGVFATVALPVFMAFELFIGFIQAYVFFVLTLIFTALAQEGHHDSDDHSPADSAPKIASQRE
jgi:F-type H+-transporting ATPase subunit a